MKFIPQFEPYIKYSYIWEVVKQLYSGWIGHGPAVQEFEKEIKNITGADHVLSTTSGTTALIMAINSLGLKKGSTILFPSYTFLAGANASRFMGYRVKLVDIKADTLCMDPDKIEVTPEVSAIMFVNHNGYVGPDVGRVRDVCDQNNIPMIEDSSQALGMQKAGQTGDVGVFSFSVPKIISTGQGGAVITNNKAIAAECRKIRDQGGNWRKTKIHEFVGINLKFNDIQASYGIPQLKNIGGILKKRKRLFDYYRKHLEIIDYGYESSWMILYRTKKADEIIEALAAKNIQAVKYYKPVNNNPPYKTNKKYPVAQEAYEQVLYLPSSLTLGQKHVNLICKVIKKKESNNG